MIHYSTTLKQIIEDARPRLDNIDNKRMSLKSSPEKWSKKEILGHLIDSAYNNHQRFALATQQDNLILQGYDQVAWVKLHNYQNRDKDEIINTWATANLHLAHLIGQINDETLLKKTTNHNFDQICMKRLPKGSETSLSYLVWDYIFHLEHHLAQIIDDYQPILPAFTE